MESRGEIDRLFRRHRFTVMITLILGYGFSYTCRLGLSVVKKPLIDQGVYTAEQLGWIGAAFLWGYGMGKLFNGFLADRLSIRRAIPTGLFLSAVVNLWFGCTTWAALAVALWATNGWFQGFGAPASVVGLSQWFTSRERGTMYGLWSASHSLGEFCTYVGTAALVAATAWNTAFIGPGAFCILVAVGVFAALRDRPGVVGLPPVAEWKGERVPVASRAAASTGSAQLQLLRTPAIWVVGLASACMYVTRYAINNWGVLYLQEAHGFSLVRAGAIIGVSTIAGIGGSAAYGFISDRYFGARRPPLTLIFGLAEVASLVCIFVLAPRGHTVWLSVGLCLYGFTLSGLLAVLGGLFAVDIAPRNATGAAMGVIGVFSYIGAGVQEVVSGWLVDRASARVGDALVYDFTVPVTFWIAASVVSLLLAASLWNVRSSDAASS